MNYTSPSPHDSTKQVVEKNTKAGADSAKNVKPNSEAKVVDESKDEDDTIFSDQENDEGQNDDTMAKRKRNQMTDLPFEKELAEIDGRSKRKDNLISHKPSIVNVNYTTRVLL